MQGQQGFSPYNHHIDEQRPGPFDNMSRYIYGYGLMVLWSYGYEKS